MRNFRSYRVVGYFSYLLWWKMALHFMAWYLMFSFRVSLACQGFLTPSELKHVNGCSQSCPYLHACEWEILQLHESTVKLIRLCRVCNMLFINLTGFCLSFSDLPASSGMVVWKEEGSAERTPVAPQETDKKFCLGSVQHTSYLVCLVLFCVFMWIHFFIIAYSSLQ